MSTRLVHVVVDANDPARLARFWAAALDWEIADETPEEVDVFPAGYTYPDPAALGLVFVPVPEPKSGQNRVHLDLRSDSAKHQADNIQRLVQLGAVPADVGQGAVPWTVLADPEGNEFCVLDPRPEYAGTGTVAAIVIHCTEPARLSGFWQQASGFAPARSGDGLTALRAAGGVGPYLELIRVPHAKTGKNRLHPDVAPHFGEDPVAEVDRLKQAGAVAVDLGQGRVSWTVLADPEGNEFCVLSPR